VKAERARDFEVQRRLLLLETLYDAALALSSAPPEDQLAEEILSRAVAVLDASRGFFLIVGDDGEVVSRAAVGFSRRATALLSREEPFLLEIERSTGPLRRQMTSLLGTPAANAVGVALGAQGRRLGWLVLADKESRDASPAFGSEDERFLSSLAALAEVALERRRHVARLERDRERLEDENRRLRDETGRAVGDRLFIGESAAMRRVFDLIQRAAVSSVSVLITGPSGTGKELVARLLHEKSPRGSSPFVAINCAALPETLLEAELFGIEKGIATGVDSRAGRFEQAGEGTVFLDEIGDMPPALQAKILRVLQEREFERVGGRRRIHLGARIVSATHADLKEKIERREFREDLYYRLRVLEIFLPPLSARREDLPRLIRYFLDRFAAREKSGPLSIDREAMAALLAQPFPGNVRELENLLEGASALAREGVIHFEDLQWIERRAREAPASIEEQPATSLKDLEQRHIERVLKLTRGNKSRAARILGIDRRTIYRKSGT
jgi:transcriptional regulator with GAF, ATPase, and Fis domain